MSNRSTLFRNTRSVVAFIGATLLVLAVAWLLLPENRLALAAKMDPLEGVQPAPAFPTGLDWINTDGEELSLEDLRGKVVLLDFWTYGCINCYHIIPDLKKLEGRYGDALVVIGVHSAKFSAEGNTRRIRMITHRYEREHPVANDKDFLFWNRYGVRAWPTLVLIDPAGRIVGQVSGEGHYELLDEAIGRLVETFAARDMINDQPLGYEPFWKAEDLAVDTFLRFPGKIIADDEHLYIADSNNHRIVITDHAGRIDIIVGNGKPELCDGSFAEASFQQPQGMALDANGHLIVADTLNNAIRRIDFERQTVETLAGTGEQVYMRADGYAASGTPLNSPWDVLVEGEYIYIAMAGQHQLWRLNTSEGRLEAFAGTRREALQDGPRLRGALNQPSGLASDGERLYFADAEASAIRYAEYADDGKLDTIVGTGLFDFGDVDGKGGDVRLQHPLGIDFVDGKLFVADTYNDKIKVINPALRTSKTLLGGNGELYEPGGLDVHRGKVWIADTNHHAIKVYDMESGELDTLDIVPDTD